MYVGEDLLFLKNDLRIGLKKYCASSNTVGDDRHINATVCNWVKELNTLSDDIYESHKWYAFIDKSKTMLATSQLKSDERVFNYVDKIISQIESIVLLMDQRATFKEELSLQNAFLQVLGLIGGWLLLFSLSLAITRVTIEDQNWYVSNQIT